MFPVCLLALATGFLSLSMEILWIRLFSFANFSMPQSFSFVLACYLVGIALGSSVGKWFCQSTDQLWKVCGCTLLISSLLDLSSPWLYSLSVYTHWQLLAAGGLITLTSLLKAIPFPIAHHLGAYTANTHIGRKISRVYVCNILGSTMGPLFTGILLLTVMTTQQSFIVCSALTFLVALFCLLQSVSVWLLGMSAAAMTGVILMILTVNSHALIKAIGDKSHGKIIDVVENQFGIVSTYPDVNNGVIVMGGNVYDGRTNLDPVLNSNRISRLIVLSTLVEKPKQVLMIGLSIGSWLKIVTSFPGIENIDVVEINPGYLELIKHYPAQQSALDDPRVHLFINDGRRWLNMHPDRRYDLIIMNTTYHWRAYASNLLSEEFLRMIKRHMNPNAVLSYNSTWSPDVLKTATEVFNYAYLYNSFIIAADFDWRQKLNSPQAENIIRNLKLDGKLLYPPGSDKSIASVISEKLLSLPEVEALASSKGRSLEIITDQNLITEFKYGRKL